MQGWERVIYTLSVRRPQPTIPTYNRQKDATSIWNSIVYLLQCCACYLGLRVTQCIHWAVHCLCSMCQLVLLMMLWLLIGTRLRLLAVELLCTAEPLYPFRRLFGTILVILCLMAWDWRVLRAEPMLSFWPNLRFIFVSYCFLFFIPFMGWLCGVWSSDS